ncbi:MAG: phosphatase PAP2 family protein [Hyphomicrobiales bacterium]
MAVFDFPSRKAWALLVIAGALAYGALLAMGVTIRAASLLLPFSAVAFCLGGSLFYSHARPDRRLAVIMVGTAFVLAFGATAGVLTYPATAIGGALRDDMFITFERSIGVDWPSLATHMTAFPALNFVWAVAYMSSLPQIAVAVLVLGFTGRHERLSGYLSLILATLLCTLSLFMLAPALGPIPSYGIGADLYARLGEGGKSFLSDFLALRGGRFTTFDLGKLEGIITFPSFHCALAILTGWALAPVRWIRAPAIVLNGLVILSTVPQGGHYVADILAGSLITSVALAIAIGAKRPLALDGIPAVSTSMR